MQLRWIGLGFAWRDPEVERLLEREFNHLSGNEVYYTILFGNEVYYAACEVNFIARKNLILFSFDFERI